MSIFSELGSIVGLWSRELSYSLIPFTTNSISGSTIIKKFIGADHIIFCIRIILSDMAKISNLRHFSSHFIQSNESNMMSS